MPFQRMLPPVLLVQSSVSWMCARSGRAHAIEREGIGTQRVARGGGHFAILGLRRATVAEDFADRADLGELVRHGDQVARCACAEANDLDAHALLLHDLDEPLEI